MSRYTSGVAVSAILATAVLPLGLRRLGDFDLPWHLAIGRAVFAGTPVAHDDFSYTFRGQATPNEYLSQIALYLAHRAGGAIALQLLGLSLIAAAGWWMVSRARPEGWASAAAAVLGLAVAGPWLSVRPTLFSVAAFALELHLIDRHRRTARTRTLAWAIPLQLLWANAHGFAVIGAALLAAYAGYVAACRAARGRLGALVPPAEGAAPGRVLAVAVAAVAATAASSHGLAIFSGPFAVAGAGRLTTEWVPLTFGFVVHELPLLAVLSALALVALALGRDPERRPSLWDAGVVAATLALAIGAVRMIPLFAVASAPVVARRLWPIVARARGATALGVLIVLAATGSTVGSRVIHLGLGWDDALLPRAALGFAAAARPRGPLFNRLGYGGEVIWELYPDVRVFVDGRTAWLYPVGFLLDYRRALDSPSAFASLQRTYGFEWALLGGGGEDRHGRGVAGDPAWSMVYLDDTASLYVRRDGPNADLAARGYRLVSHLTEVDALIDRPPPADDLSRDARLAVAQAPRSARAHLFAACAALARRDVAGAASERDIAKAIDRDAPGLDALDQRIARFAP